MTPRNKRIFIAVFAGFLAGMLTFYYVRYVAPESGDSARVVRADRYLRSGTVLKREMVRIEGVDGVDREFVEDPSIIREEELDLFIGKRVAMDIDDGALIFEYQFAR